MQIGKGDLVTLNNDRKYLVLSKVEYKGENYLYLTSSDEPYEIMIVKEKIKLEIITDEELIKNLSILFYKDIKDLLV